MEIRPPKGEPLLINAASVLTQYLECIPQGYAALSQSIESLEIQDPALYSKSRNAFNALQNKLHTHLGNKRSYTRAILDYFSGKEWKEILDISNQEMQSLYLPAKAVFEQGNYEKAQLLFSFLAWIDISNINFILYLGHSLYHSSHFEKALKTYLTAAHILSHDPWPVIYAASCYLAMNDIDAFRHALRSALQIEEMRENKDADLIAQLKEQLEIDREAEHPSSGLA